MKSADYQVRYKGKIVFEGTEQNSEGVFTTILHDDPDLVKMDEWVKDYAKTFSNGLEEPAPRTKVVMLKISTEVVDSTAQKALKNIYDRLASLDPGVDGGSPADKQMSEAWKIADDALGTMEEEEEQS